MDWDHLLQSVSHFMGPTHAELHLLTSFATVAPHWSVREFLTAKFLLVSLAWLTTLAACGRFISAGVGVADPGEEGLGSDRGPLHQQRHHGPGAPLPGGPQ